MVDGRLQSVVLFDFFWCFGTFVSCKCAFLSNLLQVYVQLLSPGRLTSYQSGGAS